MLMVKTLQIKDFLALQPDRILLDVRTPAEFEHAHLPGAENLPLFSNEERAEVGTLYKQVSPEKAFLRGLDMAGAKMSWYVKEAYRLAPGRKVAVHCWRGGKRSASLGTLLAFSGFDVCLLAGGYKAYRNHILEEFVQRKTRFVVIGGKTGSGKTEILKQLAALGEQIIDLEGLANHKGSAFGALGQKPQPGVEQFENNLFQIFNRLDPGRRVWVENESRSIGRVFIPQGFWDQMKASPLMRLDVPFEERTRFLIEGYGAFHAAELEACLAKIEKRMGGQNVKTALDAFQKGDLQTATEIALHYYDTGCSAG
jgi:tRNA 2-selenouridine synthase